MSQTGPLHTLEQAGRVHDALRAHLAAYRARPQLTMHLDGVMRCLAVAERAGPQLDGALADEVRRSLGYLPRFGAPGAHRVAFVDHSFHSKTLSSGFFVEWMRRHAEVDVYWSFAWQGGSDDHVDALAAQYEQLVFWQVFPPAGLPERVQRQVVVVPMLDAVGHWTNADWWPYRACRFVSFCGALHERLLAMGFDSLRVWAPPPEPLVEPATRGPGRPVVYFWQRIAALGWPQVAPLFRPADVRAVLLQQVPDPAQPLPAAHAAEGTGHEVERIGWVASRTEHQERLAKCDLFVSPRLCEGIGMAVLEAMALGCVPVVHDEPAQNEYVDERVRYPFRAEAPRPLDLEALEDKRRALPGHVAWLKSRWEGADQELRRWVDGVGHA